MRLLRAARAELQTLRETATDRVELELAAAAIEPVGATAYDRVDEADEASRTWNEVRPLLSSIESRIVGLVAAGRSQREIAETLGLPSAKVWGPETPVAACPLPASRSRRLMHRLPYRILVTIVTLLARSDRDKHLEIIVLRHQLTELRRQIDGQPVHPSFDEVFDTRASSPQDADTDAGRNSIAEAGSAPCVTSCSTAPSPGPTGSSSGS